MRRNALWLFGASAGFFLVLLPFSAYVAAVPLIRKEWSLSNFDTGLVFSAYLVGNALSALVLVPLTDRMSPRRIWLAGIVLLAASHLLFPLLAHGLWVASFLRFAAGMGHVAAYVPGIQLASRRFAGAGRGTAVGIFVSAGYAGTTLSYVLVGELLRSMPWRRAYLVAALVGLLGAGLSSLVFRTVDGPEVRSRGYFTLDVFKSRAMNLVNAAYALHTAELYVARLWFPQLLGAYFLAHGDDVVGAASEAATLSGVMFSLGIAGVLVGGALSDVMGRTAAAIFIFAVSGACSLVCGFSPGSALLVVGFLYGFSTAADSAIYSTAVTELAPSDRLGAAQAAQTFVGFTIGALAPAAAGSILDAASPESGFRFTFFFNAVLAGVGVLALTWLRRLPEARGLAGGRR